MEEQGVTPHPENFAIWYDYVTGRKPELTMALDVLVSNKIEMTDARSQEIYQQYFGQDSLGLGQTCDRLTALIGQVSDRVGMGASDQSEYCDRLADISKDIGGSQSDDALSKLVFDLLSETKSIMEKSVALSSELGKTSEEMDVLKRSLEQAREEAMTDTLTGIGNRKSFDLNFRSMAAEATESGQPLSLILCDIDHFKKFNDTFGHRIGDEVLKVAARVIKDSVKGRDVPARYGGEEFAVILPNTAVAAGVVVAEHIRNTLASRALTNKKSGESYGRITLSLGVAELRLGEPLDDLVKHADEALYRAKRDGRNRVEKEADVDTPLTLSA